MCIRDRAEVFPSRQAKPARATGVGEPGDPDAVSRPQAGALGTEVVDEADHLVTRDNAGMLGSEVAFGQVQIGATHPAYRDA